MASSYPMVQSERCRILLPVNHTLYDNRKRLLKYFDMRTRAKPIWNILYSCRLLYVSGVPVRVSGKVSVDVNGVIVPDSDLQAYVATLDGRVYMAISGVPNSLGYEMQYLSVFPSVVAWLFSLHSENAYNGYQLTGQ